MGKPQLIKNLVWIDLEMTGLDLLNDKIIEIAILVTDKNLNLLDDKGFEAVIGIDQDDIEKMNKEVVKMHTKNGLLDKCLQSNNRLEDVEQQALDYISQFVGRQESPLCGSTIATDRAFLWLKMPKLNEYLHYRNIDSSTLKQLHTIWTDQDSFVKATDDHTALNDIRNSINELKFYRKSFLKVRQDA